jgi:aromatic ring-opening dioxygenase catalytic subunit (LigB family)
MNNIETKRMPVVFSGHGSPMIAIEHNDITEGMASVGRKVLEEYGRPKAILAISAHGFQEALSFRARKNQGRFTICMVFRKSCIR